jgi:hypothetical protein
MKRLFALCLLFASPLWSQSETINLGSRGKLTIYLSDAWNIEVADYTDRRIVSIKPKNDANAECGLTITFPETDRFDTKARLKQRAEIDAARYADQSVEGKAIGKPFNLKTGYGFHCDFTDPELIGKAPQKGNFKTISVGLIRLTAEVLIEVAISADGFNSGPYNELLGAIEGMEYTPGRSSTI